MILLVDGKLGKKIKKQTSSNIRTKIGCKKGKKSFFSSFKTLAWLHVLNSER